MALERQTHIFHSPRFRSVVQEAIRFFETTPWCDLLPEDRFLGCGVYGLYYTGPFKLYAKVRNRNLRENARPIYVGKAVPGGWRTGRQTDTQEPKLYQRLREHARSVAQAANLEPGDFRCRFVILNDVEVDLIVPVEAELIRKYTPLWNVVVDGFGNHDPGSGRYDQAPSEWDVLHPGRPWAERLRGEAPRREAIEAKVRDALVTLRLP